MVYSYTHVMHAITCNGTDLLTLFVFSRFGAWDPHLAEYNIVSTKYSSDSHTIAYT